MQNHLGNNHLIEIPRKDLRINDLIRNFKIIKYLDEGGYGKVYLVENINNGNRYALKLLKLQESTQENIQDFNNEIQIFTELANPNNIIVQNNDRYVARLYSFGNIRFQFIESEENHVNIVPSEYIVMDYFPRKDLYLYCKYSNGLGENFAKVIFKKIAQGIKFCHDNNICHLDIKLENILLDNNYNPVIVDFGFSKKTIDQNNNIILMNVRKGTKRYASPERFDTQHNYDGKMADIFSLGVVLFALVSGRYGFKWVFDGLYRRIRLNQIQEYWNHFALYNFSVQFKDLYIRMVGPIDLRPTIDEVLADPWLQNINEAGYVDRMNEIEHTIDEAMRFQKFLNFLEQGKAHSRSIEDNDKIYFNDEMKPDKLPFEKNDLQYYITINGEIIPFKLMNVLTNLIQKNYKNKCFIEESKSKLKLKIIFEKEVENEEKNENKINEKNENEDKDKENEFEEDDCIMKLELYESGNNEYLLHFVKLEGDIEEFYEHFIKIRKIIENN